MNPLGVVALIIAVVVGYYALTSAGGTLFSVGAPQGPLASGVPGSSDIQNPQPVNHGFFGNFFSSNPNPSPASNPPPPLPGESPYKGKVHITTIQRSSQLSSSEYAAISYSSGYSYNTNPNSQLIDVTGWRISSSRTSATLPLAFNIPDIDAAERDILLPPGGTVDVLTGTPNYTPNFRENACTAYFSEKSSFTPSLAYSCIDESRNRTKLLNQGFNGACIDTIQSIPACTMPHGEFQAGILGASCITYMNQHLNYAGCVADYRDRSDFLKNTWHVSVKQLQKIFDPIHDRVRLSDRQGLLVDEFEY